MPTTATSVAAAELEGVHRARDSAAVWQMLRRIDEALEQVRTVEAIAADEGADLSLYPASLYLIGVREGIPFGRLLERCARLFGRRCSRTRHVTAGRARSTR